MSRCFRTMSAMVCGKLGLGRADRLVSYLRVARSWRQACSQTRQACSQTRQCSCIWACRSHSSPQLLQAAAQADPKSAGIRYGNEAIIMDRVGNIDATVAAADKAIAADPSKPIPYYLKGKALINKATVDPKTNKIVAPPGCAEAYQKYLELAPDGPFAADAKSVLTEMGTTVKSTYKAGKKS